MTRYRFGALALVFLAGLTSAPAARAQDEVFVGKLRTFKMKHGGGWQLVNGLKLLAELQTEQKEYAEAEATYRELASANVGDAVKEEAELLAATVSMRAGKYAEAEKSLKAL